MNIIKIMLVSLTCTILIEAFMAFILKVRNIKDFLNIILVNIMTNPLVVSISFYINVFYGLDKRNIALIFLEISAVLIEGFIYHKYLNYQKLNGYLLSLILNIASYTIGILLNNIIW